MATSCPVGFDVAGLRAKVLATYDPLEWKLGSAAVCAARATRTRRPGASRARARRLIETFGESLDRNCGSIAQC
jgi:hypothetical protein